MRMASSQDISHILKPKPTPGKPPKKRPILGKDTPKAKADGDPSPLIEEPHHPDFPIIWVSKGDFTAVSKKVRESISDSWKIKPIGNTPRPGSLVTKDDVSVWIQPDIGPDDTLEGVIRRYGFISLTISLSKLLHNLINYFHNPNFSCRLFDEFYKNLYTLDQDEKFLTKGFASTLFEDRVDLYCVATYYETKHL